MEETLVVPVTYFAEPGPQNTDATLRLALERARQLGLAHAVVASDSGRTARRALELFGTELRVVVVTNPAGMTLPVAKLHEYLPRFRERKARLVATGVQVVPASLPEAVVTELEQAGAAVTRVDWRRFVTLVRVDLGALERVGVGLRVALVAAVWSCHAGLVPPGVPLVACAGTGFGGGGADTAIVIRPATVWREVRVLETLARPRESPPSET